ncbi:MAG: hypothetical protein RBR53_01110 [Desulforegulaceae bacterium]|nr:hypothetical protein [Desulforegulaceae bacterium]
MKIRFNVPTIVFALSLIYSPLINAEILEINEKIISLSTPPEQSNILDISSNFPDYDKLGITLLKDKKMFAQINSKVYGPYQSLGKGTPFFAPFSGISAFTAISNSNYFAVINGEEQKKYDGTGNLVTSNDGKNFAYIAQKGDKQFVVINGREGKSFDGFKNDPVFSPDGKRLAYIAFEGRHKGYVICQDKKYGPFKNINELVFSPDSSKLGFIAFKDNGWQVFIDEKESKPYKNAILLKFSKLGNFACVVQNDKDNLILLENFNEHPPYKTIGEPFYNPQGTILSYPANTGKDWQMVVNGKKEFKFDTLGPIAYSDTGNSYGYPGIKKDKPTIVINGKKEKEYDSSGLIKFSTDGRNYAYRAFLKQKGWFVVWDKKEGKAYFDVKQPIFNPVKNEIAYMAFDGKNVVMVKNENEGRKYKAITGLPKFSPKGNRLAYCASHDDKKWILNIDGIETKTPIDNFISKFPIIFESENKFHSLGVNGLDFVKYQCIIK